MRFSAVYKYTAPYFVQFKTRNVRGNREESTLSNETFKRINQITAKQC